jgi:hypothetical protein
MAIRFRIVKGRRFITAPVTQTTKADRLLMQAGLTIEDFGLFEAERLPQVIALLRLHGIEVDPEPKDY